MRVGGKRNSSDPLPYSTQPLLKDPVKVHSLRRKYLTLGGHEDPLLAWTPTNHLLSVLFSVSPDGSLQRPVQSGIPTLVVGSLRRSPTMVVRPQQFQFYPPQGVPNSPSPVMAEMSAKPAPTGEPALTCVSSRANDTRIHSAASSIIMEGKEIPVKSEPFPKPPASAPPSILVKPENSRNGTEKVGMCGIQESGYRLLTCQCPSSWSWPY